MALDPGLTAAIGLVGAAAVTALGGVLTSVVTSRAKRDQGLDANPAQEADFFRAEWLSTEKELERVKDELDEARQMNAILLLRIERLTDALPPGAL